MSNIVSMGYKTITARGKVGKSIFNQYVEDEALCYIQIGKDKRTYKVISITPKAYRSTGNVNYYKIFYKSKAN